MNPDEGIDDVGVVHLSPAIEKDGDGRFARQPRRYGRSDVSASKQSTTDRIRAPIGMSVADHARGIARAVPVLVMAAHDGHDGIRKVDQRQDVGADLDVTLHLLELGRCQPSGLLRIRSGIAELAGVVQQRRRLDRLEGQLVV